MPPDDKSGPTELRALALRKMSNVLGPDRARVLLERLLDELGITLETPQELLQLSERMSRMGGFEAAVGAMLGVTAILRGAAPANQDERDRASSTGSSRSSSEPS